MKKLTGFLGILLLGAGPAFASNSTGLGGVFRAVGMGTRPLGMGGAFVAIADDANAVQENPAGMAFFEKGARYAVFTHSNLYGISELSRDDLAFAQADMGYSAFGLSWNRFSANLDQATWNEDAFTYGGARLASKGDSDSWPKMAVGWQLKYLRVDSSLSDDGSGNSVDGATASGYGFSLGLLAKLRPSLSVGIMAQDLYSSISWASGTLEILPSVGRLGFAYRLTESSTFAAEARGLQGSSGFGFGGWNVGAEHWIFDGKALMWNTIRNVGVRAGYFQYAGNNDAGQASVGGSARADQWQIDYSYQTGLTSNQLGATHRFGLGMQF
jgi:hypothetical protein